MLLYGMHDREGAHIVPAGGWCVDVRALSENPAPTDYRQLRSDITWLVRLSWGFGSTGNIPLPAHYEEFAQRCASYVRASPGCTRWIIGNEANHAQEHPNGQPISPAQYAECYLECRVAIKAVQPQAEVLVAAVAPWNMQSGDWLAYWREVVRTLSGQANGYTLHAYTHGADPALPSSDAQVNGWYWHLRVYKQLLAEIPKATRHLPCYITECNQGDHGWVDHNSGYVQALYAEIDRHNRTPAMPKIHCLCLYRWPRYDQWYIDGKQGVIGDFKAAMQQGYRSPEVTAAFGSHTVHVPTASVAPQPAPALPPRDWDAELTALGSEIITPHVTPGAEFWRFTKGDRVTDGSLGGDRHIYGDPQIDGVRQTGTPWLVKWDGGQVIRPTEAKPGEPYGMNFPLTPGKFSLQVHDGRPSEIVTNIQMGKMTPGGWNAGEHATSAFVAELVKMPDAQPNEPQPPVGNRIPPLLHPIADPALRVISQGFGPSEIDYSPLAGHTGVDFSVPEGTPVRAADAGQVIEAWMPDAPGGLGIYVKVRHAWGGDTVYGHLSRQDVTLDAQVQRGQVIGLSGNTGNSTGPHLHFAVRPDYQKRGAADPTGYDGYVDPLPLLEDEASSQPPAADPDLVALLPLIKSAAAEAGIGWELLLSLVMAESSNETRATSSAGAMGLCGLMPGTWAEWATKIGLPVDADPFDPQNNLRVGAAYLRWCIDQVQRPTPDEKKAAGLVAYNFGIGRMNKGESPPLATLIYAYSVVHGDKLMRTWADVLRGR